MKVKPNPQKIAARVMAGEIDQRTLDLLKKNWPSGVGATPYDTFDVLGLDHATVIGEIAGAIQRSDAFYLIALGYAIGRIYERAKQ